MVGTKVGVFYSVGELCDFLDISVSYLRKLEERKIIPEANYRYKKANWVKAGNRIYSEQLVKELVPIISSFKRGVKIDEESIRLITMAFQNEKFYFNSKN
jgi:DNA-binding transcriptional MerR regulator